MASRDRKSDSARPPRTPHTPRPRRRPAKRSGRAKDAMTPNWYTRADLPPRDGTLSVKLPTDMVICLRGLSRRFGKDVPRMLQALLFNYLRVTRTEQRRALGLEPARATSEVAAWGAVTDEGSLLPWASPTAGDAQDVVKNENRVVRVLVRHVPATESREWKE
jgi:hypothetical protein